MNEDVLRYDQWIAEALSSVVKRALVFAAAEGMPGEHHFYVTFRTTTPGVDMPSHLKARYPDDMTIVLQHQYADLTVDDQAFAVTLRFQGRNARLTVPFAAITAFADPSVNFGLQIKPAAPASDKRADETATEPRAAAPTAETAPATPAAAPAAEVDKKGKVIALDSFRKK